MSELLGGLLPPGVEPPDRHASALTGSLTPVELTAACRAGGAAEGPLRATLDYGDAARSEHTALRVAARVGAGAPARLRQLLDALPATAAGTWLGIEGSAEGPTAVKLYVPAGSGVARVTDTLPELAGPLAVIDAGGCWPAFSAARAAADGTAAVRLYGRPGPGGAHRAVSAAAGMAAVAPGALLGVLQHRLLRRAAWAGDVVLAAEQPVDSQQPAARCRLALHVSLRGTEASTDAATVEALVDELGADPAPLRGLLARLDPAGRGGSWRASGVAVSAAGDSIDRVNVYVVPGT
ncbi:hypothetical protein K6U06_09980 [Acidiferrimicrobium sp. IK]|uniref:hypothetical protein n=1 Tax=Acidiferrimicrobium sp. IK TaxID=2871700 RepID=UPI0021CB4595|nr:hypothetical protein [Acidiferrimicrobium sp. IK]MCU4184688.1 hypothetical protein [Acidiferrimicrobium sp. IK]